MVRIFNTYGPRMALDDGRVVSNFVAQALTGQPMTIYGDGQQTRSFQYVSDLIEGARMHSFQHSLHRGQDQLMWGLGTMFSFVFCRAPQLLVSSTDTTSFCMSSAGPCIESA